MSLAIVGSRTFADFDLLQQAVDALRETQDVTCIVSGGAQGADKLGERYAAKHSLKINVFEPDWKKYGKVAGMIRNKDIVAAADHVLAFWDGKSKGTKNSIDHAKKMNKPLVVVRFE